MVSLTKPEDTSARVLPEEVVSKQCISEGAQPEKRELSEEITQKCTDLEEAQSEERVLPSYTPEHIAEEPMPLPCYTPVHLMTEEESIERFISANTVPKVDEPTITSHVSVVNTSDEVEYAREIAQNLVVAEKLKYIFEHSSDRIQNALYKSAYVHNYSLLIKDSKLLLSFNNGMQLEPRLLNDVLTVMRAIELEERPFKLLKLCETMEVPQDSKFIWFNSLHNFLSKVIAGSATITDYDFQVLDGVYWHSEFYAYVIPKLYASIARAAASGEIPPISEELRNQLCSYVTLMRNGKPPSKQLKFPVASLVNGVVGTTMCAGVAALLILSSINIVLLATGGIAALIYSNVSWSLFKDHISLRGELKKLEGELLQLDTKKEADYNAKDANTIYP